MEEHQRSHNASESQSATFKANVVALASSGAEHADFRRVPETLRERVGRVDRRYRYVHACSALMLLVGLLTWLFARGIIAEVSGTGVIVCGGFILIQSDLVVTYLRLFKQVHRFQANNSKLKANIVRLNGEVRELKMAVDALKELDRSFGGSVDQAMDAVSIMRAAAMANVQRNIKTICRMYCDADKDRTLDFGEELDLAFDELQCLFGSVFEDLPQREASIREVLSSSPDVVERGVHTRLFSKIVSSSLDCELIEIPHKVSERLLHS